MPAAFARLAMQDVTPGSSGAYVDVDAQDYGADAAAVGVWLRQTAAATYAFDARKNGSTDTFGYQDCAAGYQGELYVGCDPSGIFELEVEAYASQTAWIMGYMLASVSMFTNAEDKSIGVATTYTDVDVSSECPDAVFVILDLAGSGLYNNYVRKNGSSDDRYARSNVYAGTGRGSIIGVDGSQIFENKIAATGGAYPCHVMGYYAGVSATIHTNATAVSCTSDGAYHDLAALTADALLGFYTVHTNANIAYAYAFRKNGESEDPYLLNSNNGWNTWAVECDGSRIVEGKQENAYLDFWEVGYLETELITYYKTVSATVGTSATIPRAISKTVALDTVGTSAIVVRSTSKHLAVASIGTIGAIAMGRYYYRTFAAAVATAGSVVRSVGKHVTGSAGTSGHIRPFSIVRTITGTVGTAGVVARAVSKTVAAATVGTSGSVGRAIIWIKSLAATVGTSGSVARITAFHKTVSATVGAIGVTIRPIKVGRHILGTVGTAGSIRPISVWKTITATVGTSPSVIRAIAKHVALATVGTIGSIVAQAQHIIQGGVAVVASVRRKVLKNISVAVPVLGRIETTLYDIVYAMNQTIRQIFGKVRITYTDPYFSAGVDTEATETGRYTYPAQTADDVMSEQYKWFSLHRNDLGGTFHPLPSDLSISVGWWGTQLSDAVTAEFAVAYPLLTITHAARSVASLLVIGDDKLAEYPVDFTIRLYSTGDVLEHTEPVTGNTLVTWTKDLAPTVSGIVKQTLEVTKWSRVSSVCKIAQFFTTLEETYYSEYGDLLTIDVTEQREYTGTTIPAGNLAASEIRVRLNNVDGTFSAGNIYSHLHGKLLNNRAINAWLGVDLYPSGVRRWYPLGTFYSRDWSAPDEEIWAEVSGQDMLSRLQSTEFTTSEVYENKTLQELAIIVMTDAGLTSADWDIDPTLDTIVVPYAWFDRMSHREALRRIAAAALGQCYCNRDGQVVLEIYAMPSLNPYAYTEANVFTFDHPLAWSQMVNYVEVQAQPRVASAAVEIVTDAEEFTVPAGDTVTKTHFFVSSPCVDVQAPAITAGPNVSVDSWTASAWGIVVTYANAGGGDETVTLVQVDGKTLDALGSRIATAQDEDSIAQNGLQTLPEVLTSEFWQDEETAQDVADSLLASYKDPRRDVVMRGRGNIAQLLGDRVEAPLSRIAKSVGQYGIVGQDIGYDGGLQVSVTARALAGTPILYRKTVRATVGTEATISPVKL